FDYGWGGFRVADCRRCSAAGDGAVLRDVPGAVADRRDAVHEVRVWICGGSLPHDFSADRRAVWGELCDNVLQGEGGDVSAAGCFCAGFDRQSARTVYGGVERAADLPSRLF